jgi:predicted lipid-binding transport protein (Tim44 family)
MGNSLQFSAKALYHLARTSKQKLCVFSAGEQAVESGFAWGDIIVIGAIAAFIILRYRAMLGEQRGVDPEEMRRKLETERKQAGDIVQFPTKREEPVLAKKPVTAYAEPLGSAFAAMKEIDADFSPETFLVGARDAFDMVIEAFNEGDRDTLNNLLADDIFNSFDTVLKAQQAEGKRAQTTLVAMNKAAIIAAQLQGDVATITVAFESEQIQVIRHIDGNHVVEGDASLVETVDDEWVFSRKLSSNNPAWEIIQT